MRKKWKSQEISVAERRVDQVKETNQRANDFDSTNDGMQATKRNWRENGCNRAYAILIIQHFTFGSWFRCETPFNESQILFPIRFFYFQHFLFLLAREKSDAIDENENDLDCDRVSHSWLESTWACVCVLARILRMMLSLTWMIEKITEQTHFLSIFGTQSRQHSQ